MNNPRDAQKKKKKTMTTMLEILGKFARAGVLLALLAAPLALVPAVNAGNQVTIEAPAQAKKGLGLVLLISLQRS
jgi:hypothetical protein